MVILVSDGDARVGLTINLGLGAKGPAIGVSAPARRSITEVSRYWDPVGLAASVAALVLTATRVWDSSRRRSGPIFRSVLRVSDCWATQQGWPPSKECHGDDGTSHGRRGVAHELANVGL